MTSQPIGIYADKAVQTTISQLHASSCCLAQGKSYYSCSSAPSPTVSASLSSSDISDSLDVTDLEPDAYMHFASSKRFPESDSRRSHQKTKTWIAYGRPAEKEMETCAVSTTQTRIVSLPTPAPNAPAKASLEKTLRVVSMPERGATSSLIIGHKVTSIVQQDNTDDSIERQLHSGDMSTAPSLPSSPESIMIIGNQGKVSKSFLRRSQEDEHGWVTWANSPPRPIPALHGPLSLPYARCPSGAEGTIVEGDDLSNKVWGLGVDDSNSRHGHRPTPSPYLHHVPNTPVTTSQTKEQHPEALSTGSMPAFVRHRDAIIDLSKPSTFLDHPVHDSAKDTPTLEKLMLGQTADVRGNSRNHYAANGRNALHSSVDPSSLDDYNMAAAAQGLGLDWRLLLGADIGARATPSLGRSSVQTALNTSAPAFVPSSQHSRMASAHSELAAGPWEILDDTVSPSQLDYNISPPSTASPHWTPLLRNTMDNRNFPVHPDEFNARLQYDPHIQSPQSGIDGYSANLMRLMHQMGLQDSGYLQNLSKASTTGKRSHTMHAGTPNAQDYVLKDTSRFNHFINSSPILDSTTLSLPKAQQARSKEVFDSPLSSTSENLGSPGMANERRRNLSYQQPRSIPLARLIQRRLSSVAEEDISTSNYGLSILKTLHGNPQFVQMAANGRRTSAEHAQDLTSVKKDTSQSQSPATPAASQESSPSLNDIASTAKVRVKLPASSASPRIGQDVRSNVKENTGAKEDEVSPTSKKADISHGKRRPRYNKKKGNAVAVAQN